MDYLFKEVVDMDCLLWEENKKGKKKRVMDGSIWQRKLKICYVYI